MTQCNAMPGVASEKRAFTVSEDFIVDFVHKSLSFEGYTVTSEDVKAAMEKDDNSSDKKFIHIRNYKNGLLFVINLLNEGIEFDENKLKDLHELIMADLAVGGLYRNVDISIKGSNHTPPSYIKVYDRMKKYFDTMNADSDNLDEKLAFAHLQLMKIHPFLDGNGRCARIVLNYYLIKNGRKPVIIPLERKEEYFNALEEFKVNKDIQVFVKFMNSL